jgi:hypothetical protein
MHFKGSLVVSNVRLVDAYMLDPLNTFADLGFEEHANFVSGPFNNKIRTSTKKMRITYVFEAATMPT